MQIRLSSYGQASTHPSPVSRLLSEFAHDFRDGVDVNLGVGYVNEKTIPVPELTEALQAVGRDGVKYRQAFNYGSPVGSANLIASIRRFLATMRIGQLDEATIERHFGGFSLALIRAYCSPLSEKYERVPWFLKLVDEDRKSVV